MDCIRPGMGTILERYDDRVARGEVEPDAAQRDVALRLDALDLQLAGYGRRNGGQLRIHSVCLRVACVSGEMITPEY